MKDIVDIFIKTTQFANNSGWKSNISTPEPFELKPLTTTFDIGIITSTINEFEEVQNQIGNLKEYETDLDDSTLYYEGKVKTKKSLANVIVPYPIAMGVEGSICNTTKIINSFHPQYLIMVGICAGNKNITNLGDLIIAEKSINYNSVVEISKGEGGSRKKFMQDADSINKNFKAKLSRFFTKDVLKTIKDANPNSEHFTTELKRHIGMMVTGSSLMRSDEKIKEINEDFHNVKGLDMETNGFYFTSAHSANTVPKFVSIKGVSDYGDSSNHKVKSEIRGSYALINSVKATILFINNEI